jgi:hypothetical protein
MYLEHVEMSHKYNMCAKDLVTTYVYNVHVR